MPIERTPGGILMKARIRTGAHSFSVSQTGNGTIIYVRAPPVEGRANREIIKELKRLFRAESAEIVKGLKSKDKIIFLKGNPDEMVPCDENGSADDCLMYKNNMPFMNHE